MKITNKTARAAIIEYTKTLEAEKAQLQKAAEQNFVAAKANAEVANFFHEKFEKIDAAFAVSAFKGNPNRSWTWYVLNIGAILDVIKLVFEYLEEIRNKIREIRNQNAEG
jgi:hypothetical protein